MPGLPEITAVGTLTADVELRFTQGGHAVASFTVACNDRKYDKDAGKWTDGDATFLRCSVWRQAAEHAAESLSKGDRLIVTGQLRQRSYEKDGEKRTAFELDVAEIGVSIKFGPVKSQRADRSGSRQSSPATDDPWGSAPPKTGAGFADEPPF